MKSFRRSRDNLQSVSILIMGSMPTITALPSPTCQAKKLLIQGYNFINPFQKNEVLRVTVEGLLIQLKRSFLIYFTCRRADHKLSPKSPHQRLFKDRAILNQKIFLYSSHHIISAKIRLSNLLNDNGLLYFQTREK